MHLCWIPKPGGCRNPASEKCSTPLRPLRERVLTTQVFVPVIWELHTQLEETGLAQMGSKCCWPNPTRTQQTPFNLLLIRAQLEELYTDLVKYNLKRDCCKQLPSDVTHTEPSQLDTPALCSAGSPCWGGSSSQKTPGDAHPTAAATLCSDCSTTDTS